MFMRCPKCGIATKIRGPFHCLNCDTKYKYRFPKTGGHTYYSERYNRCVTVPYLYPSDGATGAFDIDSMAWWVHDVLCDRGTWDDKTKLSNWQASCVLSDILYSEGRWLRTWRWLFATFLFGGGKARENGLWRVRRNG
jgi:hypothetical protein